MGNLFLAGLPHFKVVTDHHPLIPILNNHRLDEIENHRLQRLPTVNIAASQNQDHWLRLHCRMGQRNPQPRTCHTESRYAIIELELLAVSWAIYKCKLFLAGLPHFKVFTDHHPLIPILNNHRLDEIENSRLQRLKTRIIGYNFTAEWVKGILNHAPDALSRNPVSDPQPPEMLAEQDIDNNPAHTITEVRAIMNEYQENIRLQDLSKQAEEDSEYHQI